MKLNILITGIGGPTPKGIAKSLKLSNLPVKLIGTDSSQYGPGLYHSDLFDKTYLVPKSTINSDDYWQVTENIIIQEKIDFAFIVPETEVLEWAIRQDIQSLPCKALIPKYNIAKLMFNKLELANLLSSENLAPKTIEINTTSFPSYKDISAKLGDQFWIRINKTAGALGALKIANEIDLASWKMLYGKYREDVIASSFLPGRNYAVKIFYYNGKMIMSACAERIEYLLANASPSNISGICSRGRLLNRPDIFEIAQRSVITIFNKFKLAPNGLFTVDLKENKDNMPKVTEINLRLVSFNFAFAIGGANFPSVIIDKVYYGRNVGYGYYTFGEELNFIRGVDYDLFTIPDNELKNKFE